MFISPDLSIIQRHQQGAGQLLSVHAQRHEVMWRDGSSVHLHPVTIGDCSAPDTFLRAVQTDGQRWLVIDLRTTLQGTGRAREFELDVLRLQKRDTPGVVFYTLRGAWPTAGAFLAAAEISRHAQWRHQPYFPCTHLALAA